MEENPNQKVVVSGIGLITALGGTREKTWSHILQGKSGIKKTARGLQAPVFDFVLNGAKSRMGDFAQIAVEEAFCHAGLDPFEVKGQNIGCAMGQSKPILSDAFGMLCELDKNLSSDLHVNEDRVTTSSPINLDPQLIISSFSGWSSEAIVKNTFHLTGPCSNTVAACATGIASLDIGKHWIQSGQCSMALAGASESSLHPLYVSGFEQMGVLAKGESAQCAKPFDRYRSGFVMGEGAAVLFLESLESATKRNHQPLAFLEESTLHHSSQDAIRFDEEGKSIARLIGQTLKQRHSPDYINAHGTGTLFNDRVETRGIRLALGRTCEKLAVSSTKAATGHLLGAAGALEAAFSVLSIRDQVAPPTLHLTDPDPACDLDYVPNQAQKKHVNSALSLSYGFGGQLGAVLFSRC